MRTKREPVSFLGKLVKKFDMLGHKVELNVGGDKRIQSKVGSCFTLVLTIVFILYSAIRAQQLAFREDVEVTRIELVNALSS